MNYLQVARPLLVGAALAITASVVSAAGIVKYNTPSFTKALNKGKTIVVHVHAKWCITCVRQEKPLNTELSKPAFSKVLAFQVNFDKDRDFLNKYRINTQSTIMVFKKGQLVGKSIGQTNPVAISAILQKAL